MEIELHTKGPQGELLTLQGAVLWFNNAKGTDIAEMNGKYNVDIPGINNTKETRKSYVLGLYIHYIVKTKKGIEAEVAKQQEAMFKAHERRMRQQHEQYQWAANAQHRAGRGTYGY